MPKGNGPGDFAGPPEVEHKFESFEDRQIRNPTATEVALEVDYKINQVRRIIPQYRPEYGRNGH